MKTIVLEQPEQLRCVETPPPEGPPPGWALVRVRRVGVCGTDLHAFRGRQPFFSYPRILGHELGVEVVQVNAPAAGVKPGDRCAVEPYLNCGACQPCRLGRTNCCEKLQVLGVHTDGGMRELIAVPASKLHRSAALGLDELALVEPLGVGAHAVDRAGVERGGFILWGGFPPSRQPAFAGPRTPPPP
ncbi:MAG: alcohol dehydrogenase catalytic domain-containing protein [Planctomycetes bacterium]|nr:alcohol dehydrogenase catalytic domain-containing protein [Planctomycetota bacterium]